MYKDSHFAFYSNSILLNSIIPSLVSEVVELGADRVEFTGTVPQILATVGMQVKAVVISGETNPHIINKLGSGVLGYKWDPPMDRIHLELKVNISPRTRGVPIAGPLTNETFEIQTTDLLVTKRHILSATNSLYDPLGLLAPYLLKYKLLMREVVRVGLEWDVTLPQPIADAWVALLRDLV